MVVGDCSDFLPAAQSRGERVGGFAGDMGAVGFPFLGCMPCFSAATFRHCQPIHLARRFVWFRFPLFAMAVVFWLGGTERMINAMLLSVGLGMITHVHHPAAEIFNSWANHGRLSWPYGDLGPGQLSCQGMFACVRGGGCDCHLEQPRTASWAAIIALISIVGVGDDR